MPLQNNFSFLNIIPSFLFVSKLLQPNLVFKLIMYLDFIKFFCNTNNLKILLMIDLVPYLTLKGFQKLFLYYFQISLFFLLQVQNTLMLSGWECKTIYKPIRFNESQECYQDCLYTVCTSTASAHCWWYGPWQNW